LPGSEPGLTRRDLLLSGAAAAGYALAAGPVSADAIRTPADGLEEGLVEIPAADGAMPAYRARPEEGPTPPVVLVVHEIFGIHEYVKDVCRRLATQGYLAVAPDLYRRHGDVSSLTSIEEVISRVVRKVPDAEVLADLDAVVPWADSDGGDPSRLGIVGFCWGGRIVWLYAAHSTALKAGVAWYGRLAGAERPETPRHPLDLAGELHAPVLGLYGGDDAGIPQESVDAMRARLPDADGSEIVVFPGAPHGFHADYRTSYRELAAAEGWRRMLAWFREHGVG
jgi:carboxymethylenebutenolidase